MSGGGLKLSFHKSQVCGGAAIQIINSVRHQRRRADYGFGTESCTAWMPETVIPALPRFNDLSRRVAEEIMVFYFCLKVRLYQGCTKWGLRGDAF